MTIRLNNDHPLRDTSIDTIFTSARPAGPTRQTVPFCSLAQLNLVSPLASTDSLLVPNVKNDPQLSSRAESSIFHQDWSLQCFNHRKAGALKGSFTSDMAGCDRATGDGLKPHAHKRENLLYGALATHQRRCTVAYHIDCILNYVYIIILHILYNKNLLYGALATHQLHGHDLLGLAEEVPQVGRNLRASRGQGPSLGMQTRGQALSCPRIERASGLMR
jgi:hypothetical protein